MKFKLLFKEKREDLWKEIMVGTRSEIYEWLGDHSGYDSKIIKV